VSTNTQVSWSPIALCTIAAATAEVDATRQPADHAGVTDLLADLADGLLDDRDVRPRRAAARDVEEKRLEDLLTALGVRDLGWNCTP